jgi:rare lipoprotein A
MRLTGITLALTLLATPALAHDSGRVVYRETGEGSWYGPGFHGRKAANGSSFDQNALTAAHPELPLGSEVRVTSLENGRTVTVEIIDRGPYAEDRNLDLSKAAARRLDMLESGTAPVRIEATAPQIERAATGPGAAANVEQGLAAEIVRQRQAEQG